MLPEAHFTLQDIWLEVSDHCIVVIWIFKIFYVLFFHVFLPPLLLGDNHFCPFIMAILAWNISLIPPIFLKRYLVFSSLFYLPLFLCIFHWRRPSYLSLLISGALHLIEYIFSFLHCLSPLFFLQLFAKLPKQPHGLPAFLFLWDGFGCCLYIMLLTSIHHALCLWGLIPWLYSSPLLYNCKGFDIFDIGHTWLTGLEVFPLSSI